MLQFHYFHIHDLLLQLSHSLIQTHGTSQLTCENWRPQSSHLKGFSPAWWRMCAACCDGSRNDLGHSAHGYGRSFVWMRWCVLRLSMREKRLPHASHVYGRSPVCVRTCRFRLPTWTQLMNARCNVSLHFNGHFPGESGLAGVHWSKRWWKWWWQLSYKTGKAPVKLSPPTPNILQAGCPTCRPANSLKALKENISIPWTCLPQFHLGVFQLCLWPLIAPGYLGEWLPCLASALWCQYKIQCLLVKYTLQTFW